MLKIAICDDMPEQLVRIKTATVKYLQTHSELQGQVFCAENAMLLLQEVDKTGSFDVMLLDICMPGMNGTELAREIRQRGDKTEIVFLTTSAEFAVTAFSLKAAHYLIKPFTQVQFDEAMCRACAALGAHAPCILPIKLPGGGIKTVEIAQIIYIESFLHEQKINLEDTSAIVVRASMTNLLTQLELLSPGQFLSPYKGYIVNLDAVRSVEPDGMRMRGGKTVPIVRRNIKKLSEHYFAYAFREQRGTDAARSCL